MSLTACPHGVSIDDWCTACNGPPRVVCIDPCPHPIGPMPPLQEVER